MENGCWRGTASISATASSSASASPAPSCDWSPDSEQPLWNKITEVIPHYQTHYRVDGVMVDRGHALLADLKRGRVARARQIDTDFALWAEEFNLSPAAREEGYNVCVGPFMQTVRNVENFRGGLRWIPGARRRGSMQTGGARNRKFRGFLVFRV